MAAMTDADCSWIGHTRQRLLFRAPNSHEVPENLARIRQLDVAGRSVMLQLVYKNACTPKCVEVYRMVHSLAKFSRTGNIGKLILQVRNSSAEENAF